MDFLTRLAQRSIGELPTVQPRLPARFEPIAGIAQPATAPADELRFAPPRPAIAAPALESLSYPAPASSPVARPADQATTESPGPPMGVIEAVRPATLAPERVIHEEIVSARDIAPDPARRQPPDLAAAPRRVAVEVRPAVMNPSQPPPAVVGFRRGAVTAGPTDGRTKLQADGVMLDSAAPSTVHVHIGRVDVRAVMPPAAPPRPAARPATPRPTLEDYLSGRKGGSQP
jgi:hypothetical protein